MSAAAAAAGGAAAASALRIETEAGAITLRLRPDAAPETVKYILQCVASRLYDGREFYRSDFVIQFGLHGSGVENPHGNLSVNETSKHAKLSNLRGSCSVAHWDVPDCAHSAPQSPRLRVSPLSDGLRPYMQPCSHVAAILRRAEATTLGPLMR